MKRDMPTSVAAGTPAARPTGRRRIAGDRGRRQPAGADDGDRGALATRPGAPEVLTSEDPLDRLEVLKPEPGAGDATPATATRDGRRPAWIVAALTASLVAVLAASLLAALTTRAQRADLRAGDSALAAAKPETARILSYDYRRLDADFAAATAVTTGSFRTDYQATTAKAVKSLATQTQAVVVAKVVAGGVVSSSANHATLLLFVNQTTTSNRLSSAKTDLTRVQVTMTRSGSRWLVSGLKAL